MTHLAKPPVVLIHGMWSTAATLADLEAEIQNMGYEVHTPSLPLHIPIPEHTTETQRALARTSMLDYLAFLENYVSKLREPPIVIGHSMGGLLAQMLATRIQCDRLILISSAAPAGINSWSWSVIRTFGKNLLKFPLWLSTTEIGLPNIVYGIANTQTKKIQQEILEKSTYESGRASTEIGLWFVFRDPPTRVDYSAIQCPVLMISGTKDCITPKAIQYRVHSRFQGKAKLAMIEGACHWTVGGSFQGEVMRELQDWLAETEEVKAA